MKAKQEALVKEREKQLAKKEQSKELQLWVPSLEMSLVLGGGSGCLCTSKGGTLFQDQGSGSGKGPRAVGPA